MDLTNLESIFDGIKAAILETANPTETFTVDETARLVASAIFNTVAAYTAKETV